MDGRGPDGPRGRSGQVATWAVAALVALVPVHAVFLDVGFSLKPWFVPLFVGLGAARRSLWQGFLRLPGTVRYGMVALLLGGTLGVAASGDPVTAIRHLAALALAMGLLLLLVAVPRIPYLGVALRVGGILMGVATLVEAALVLGGTVPVRALAAGTSISGPLADIVYGDIVVVHGLHVDSNFAAFYAAVWIFLLLGYPAERFFGRRSDGVIVGMLVIQLVLTLSKTGAVALGAGILVVLVASLGRSRRVLRAPSVVWILVVVLGVGAVLTAIDGTDGRQDIAYGIEKRTRQVRTELRRLEVLARFIGDDLGGGTGPEPELLEFDAGQRNRAAQWRAYFTDFRTRPLTGVGLGTPTAPVGYAHNAALESAGGAGVLGLVGWLLVWIGVAAAAVRILRRNAGGAPLLGAVVVVFFASLFLTTNYEPLVALVFGLVLAPHLPALPSPAPPGPDST